MTKKLTPEQLLNNGYIKVGSKSYCEYWKKGDESRHIKLYIPSQRMRNLLESWLNDEYEV